MAETKKAPAKTKRVRKSSAKSPSRKTTKPAVEQPPVVSTEQNRFTPVTSLLKTSWDHFKQTFLSYLKIVGVGIGMFIIIGFVGLILGIPLMVSVSGSTSHLFNHPTPLQVVGMILIVVWVFASIAVSILYFIYLPVASLLIIDSSRKLSIAELYKKGKPFLLPYFLTSLLTALVVLGGWVLLILPGILFNVFFVFVAYVVVIEKKAKKEALLKSYLIVKNHFWQVLGFVALIQTIVFIGSYIFDKLSQQSDGLTILSFIFSLVAGWYSQIYIYHLYKKYKAVTPANTVISMRWIWIVAIIGWVVLGILLVVLSSNGFGFLRSQDPMNLLDTSA